MELREAEARILGVLAEFEKDNPRKCITSLDYERIDVSTFEKHQLLPQVYIRYTDSSENLWSGDDPRGVIIAVKPEVWTVREGGLSYEVIPDKCSDCGQEDDSIVDDLRHRIQYRIGDNRYICIGCAAEKHHIPEALALSKELGG